jgi:hypothetical protein
LTSRMERAKVGLTVPCRQSQSRSAAGQWRQPWFLSGLLAGEAPCESFHASSFSSSGPRCPSSTPVRCSAGLFLYLQSSTASPRPLFRLMTLSTRVWNTTALPRSHLTRSRRANRVKLPSLRTNHSVHIVRHAEKRRRWKSSLAPRSSTAVSLATIAPIPRCPDPQFPAVARRIRPVPRLPADRRSPKLAWYLGRLLPYLTKAKSPVPIRAVSQPTLFL